MSSSHEALTTREFAKKAGVSASTISKWLRKNKIKGHKKNGKWLIPSAELANVAPRGEHGSPKRAPSPISSKPEAVRPQSKSKCYSIKEFSRLTYLTEYGVEKWLKDGRLTGVTDENGQACVAASNLEQPNVKRLVR